jgi:beta-lactamase superfamily II metal-dependent hydrolase
MPPTTMLRRAAPLLVLLTVAVCAMALGVFLSGGRGLKLLGRPGPLTVGVVAVGNGEASWVKTPNGRFIVIGGGPPGAGGRVVGSLKDAGAERVDLLILPYPYAEAIGGVPEVMAAFPVESALETGGPEINQHLAEVRRYLRGDRTRVMVAQAGDVLTLDDVRIEVLAPGVPPPPGTAADDSLVVAVRYGDTRFLWAGGLGRAGERALLSRTPDLAADWLRVARSGAADASSPEFLRLVSPEFAVISTGGVPGLPAPETLGRLAATGARLYRTDRRAPADGGTLLFQSDGVRVTPARR